jgi:hypothetical protein
MIANQSIANQSTHVRLPQRSDSVEGREAPTDQPPKVSPVKDPRTVTQDPTLKPKGSTP